MGYERVADIPQSQLDDYSRLLVARFGAKRAAGMAARQVAFRKRQQPEQRERFEYVRDYINEHYTSKRVDGWRTEPR